MKCWSVCSHMFIIWLNTLQHLITATASQTVKLCILNFVYQECSKSVCPLLLKFSVITANICPHWVFPILIFSHVSLLWRPSAVILCFHLILYAVTSFRVLLAPRSPQGYYKHPNKYLLILYFFLILLI